MEELKELTVIIRHGELTGKLLIHTGSGLALIWTFHRSTQHGGCKWKCCKEVCRRREIEGLSKMNE